MKVRFKLKFIYFTTDYVIVEIPDDEILDRLELENMKEVNISDSYHINFIFDIVWDEIKGDVEIKDFEILNKELYPIPPKEEYEPKYNLKRV